MLLIDSLASVLTDARPLPFPEGVFTFLHPLLSYYVKAMRQAFSYTRVSSKEQEREGFSIPAQIALLREYASRNSLQVVREFEEAETAKSSGREQFAEMLEVLKKRKKPAVLLVEKTDRLYRNFKDFIAIDDLINESGLEVHLVKEGEILGKSANSHTKLIHGIKVVLAKNYIDNLSEEIRKGMAEKRAQGGWPHKAPVGYRNVKKELVIDPETAPYVREAFRLFATGLYSLTALREELFSQGFTYRADRPKMTRSGLGKLLQSRFYIGEMEINGEIFDGKHEPLVSVEVWLAAHRAFRKGNKPESYNRREFKFGGVMTCGECGAPVVGELKKGGKYTYYRCSRLKRGCSQGYVNESVIEPQVDALVYSLRVPEDIKEKILACVTGLDELANATVEEEMRKLNAQLTRTRSHLRKSYQDRLQGIIDEEMYRAVSVEFRDTIKALEGRLGKIGSADEGFLADCDILLELPVLLSRSWFQGTPSKKRRLIKILCSNFLLRDGKIEYELKDPFPMLTERGLKTEWWRKEGNLRTILLHSEEIRAIHALLAA
jgi:site-specific DNA recombinase